MSVSRTQLRLDSGDQNQDLLIRSNRSPRPDIQLFIKNDSFTDITFLVIQYNRVSITRTATYPSPRQNSWNSVHIKNI